MYPYPVEVPTKECLDLVIKALRGQVDPKESAHAAWVLVGYALSQWDKHPPVVGDVLMSHADVAHALGLAPSPEAIPWSIVLPILLDLLSRLIKR